MLVFRHLFEHDHEFVLFHVRTELISHSQNEVLRYTTESVLYGAFDQQSRFVRFDVVWLSLKCGCQFIRNNFFYAYMDRFVSLKKSIALLSYVQLYTLRTIRREYIGLKVLLGLLS